ncbi:SDR family NAD(P)-dependent oxidoreductase [Rhodococcus wratislaviensis]|uniref:SDR family NAD(P)-dependent oxidoreductase n=1 Tax=Rhodococcus wratislaviensis TaxID=44752 RepID=UPI003654A601
MVRLLHDKIAIVTGAGHGIGRGHALELAKHGAKVIVNDLGGSVDGGSSGSNRAAENVVGIIRDRGGVAIADFGDVGDEQQVDAMVQRAIDEFGRVDILVNNAGIVRDRAVWNMSVEDFDLVMRVHVRGTWLASRAVARYWRDRAKASEGTVFGRIVNTTSGSGLHGNFGQSNYSAAKSAIVGLTQTLSVELASIGVTANAISPGGRTRLSATRPGAKPVPEADEVEDDVFDPKDPTLSCPVVAWLASEQSQYLSGQVIRAIGENIELLRGWSPEASISNGGSRWDATRLGTLIATDLYRTRAAGLRLGG